MATHSTDVIAPRLLSALADEGRFQLLAQIATGVVPAGSAKDLKRLADTGVIEPDGDSYTVNPAIFRKAVDEFHDLRLRSQGPVRGADEYLNKYFDAYRLRDIPQKPEHRAALYKWLVDDLLEGKVYTEGEVNALMRTVYHDHAYLRRELVDAGYLERNQDGTSYRKATSSPA